MKSISVAVLLSCLAAPTPARAQVAREASPLSIGETFTLQSAALSETRRINVYLPAGYAASADARYPVMYMPDGGLAEDFLHIAGLFQVLQGNGTMRPFILVGIENTQRRRDMTGPTTNAKDKKIAPVVGGSAAFRSFIRTELMPLVKGRYRTTSETGVMGESLAGLFVVETFFLEPDLFDTYVALDPSLWWNNHALLDSAPARLRAMKGAAHQLYLSNSNEPEIATHTAQLADALKKGAPASLRWYHEPLPLETHATIYHPAALQALRRLFPPPAEHR